MRNPLRTFRKRSYKPRSKKKLWQYKEELFEAELALNKWFVAYMANLHSEAGMARNNADLEALREMVK